MNIKKGDVLKSKSSGFTYKVMGVADGVYFLGTGDNMGCNFYTLEGLKETFELPEEKWEGKLVHCNCEAELKLKDVLKLLQA